MKKHKITIGLLAGNETITMLDGDKQMAEMAFGVIAQQEFEEAVELNLIDPDGRVLESMVVKPKTQPTT